MKPTVEKLKSLAQDLLGQQHFDCLAVGVIDFSHHSFFSIDLHPALLTEAEEPFHCYYDLASLTKPLLLASTYLRFPHLFGQDELLLLNHQGGLPSGGRLSRSQWKEQILSYPIKKSPTVYSDYSALRLMLELEKKEGVSLRTLTHDVFHDHLYERILFWQDLPKRNLSLFCPITGERSGKKIQGEVHDPNAFNLGEFCSHAGLFSTIDDLCQTLITLDKTYHLLPTMKDHLSVAPTSQQFVGGWDRCLDPSTTLAGKGASLFTFGHLGFTGTSIWIDITLKKGHIILSNATKSYWYDRQGLNSLRKTIGEFIWNCDFP